MQWHIEIGIFNTTSKARYFKKKSLWVAAPVVFLQFWILFSIYTTNFIC